MNFVFEYTCSKKDCECKSDYRFKHGKIIEASTRAQARKWLKKEHPEAQDISRGIPATGIIVDFSPYPNEPRLDN